MGNNGGTGCLLDGASPWSIVWKISSWFFNFGAPDHLHHLNSNVTFWWKTTISSEDKILAFLVVWKKLPSFLVEGNPLSILIDVICHDLFSYGYNTYVLASDPPVIRSSKLDYGEQVWLERNFEGRVSKLTFSLSRPRISLCVPQRAFMNVVIFLSL